MSVQVCPAPVSFEMQSLVPLKSEVKSPERFSRSGAAAVAGVAPTTTKPLSNAAANTDLRMRNHLLSGEMWGFRCPLVPDVATVSSESRRDYGDFYSNPEIKP
jgi:hypothetical protein